MTRMMKSCADKVSGPCQKSMMSVSGTDGMKLRIHEEECESRADGTIRDAPAIFSRIVPQRAQGRCRMCAGAQLYSLAMAQIRLTAAPLAVLFACSSKSSRAPVPLRRLRLPCVSACVCGPIRCMCA